MGSVKLQEAKNMMVKSKEIIDFPTRFEFLANNKSGLTEKFILIILLFFIYRNALPRRRMQNRLVG